MGNFPGGTQKLHMNRSTLEFHPTANVGDEGHIDFHIPSSDENYLHLTCWVNSAGLRVAGALG